VLEKGIDAGDNSLDDRDRSTYNELLEQINLRAKGLERENSVTNIIRHRILVLLLINSNTGLEN
jgi:hypothetical protein